MLPKSATAGKSGDSPVMIITKSLQLSQIWMYQESVTEERSEGARLD